MGALSTAEKILNPADPSIAGLIPVGSTVAGGIANLIGDGKAFNTDAAGADTAMKTVQDAGAQIQPITDKAITVQNALLDPYKNAGGGALDLLSKGINDGSLTAPFSYTAEDMKNDPAYQFTLDQANKNLTAKAAAQGLNTSGGALRNIGKLDTQIANQSFLQDKASAEQTWENNRAARLSALQQLAGTGLTAATNESTAAGHWGDQNVQGLEWTATQMADLQQAKADAIASGNIAKANQISGIISGVAKQIYDSQTGKPTSTTDPQSSNVPPDPQSQQTPTAPNDANPALPIASGAGGALAALLLSGQLTGGPPIAPEVPPPPGAVQTFPEAQATHEKAADQNLPNGSSFNPAVVAPGALAAVGAATGFGAPAAEAGGAVLSMGAPLGATEVGSAASEFAAGTAQVSYDAAAPASGLGQMTQIATKFLTNPITIGVGAGILAVTAWLKSQAHWEANDQTTHFQKPFDDGLAQVRDGIKSAAQSGQLDPGSVDQAKQTISVAVQAYEQHIAEWISKGGDKKTVAQKAQATFDKMYGPNGTYFLDQIDRLAAGGAG